MKIQNTAGSGVEGTQVTNFTFANGTVDNSGTGGGADDSNIAFNDQAAGTENNLSGTVSITNNTLTNARWHGIMIQNFNGTISDAVITGNTITSSTSAASSLGYGINLQILGSATTVSNLTRATISGNTVSNFPSAGGIQVQGGNSNAAGPAGILGVAGSGSDIISILNNGVRGQSAGQPHGHFRNPLHRQRQGSGNVDVSSNGTVATPIGNNVGTTIGVGANGNTTLTATTSNNFIEANHPGTTGDSGISGGVGVTFGVTDVATMTWTITGNNVRNVDGNGILAVARGTNGTLRVKIQNNDVEAPQAGVRPGIRVGRRQCDGRYRQRRLPQYLGQHVGGERRLAGPRPAQAVDEPDGACLRHQRHGGDEQSRCRGLRQWAEPGRQWHATDLGNQRFHQLLAAVRSIAQGGGATDGRTLSLGSPHHELRVRPEGLGPV
jgi:hypothetical protein